MAPVPRFVTSARNAQIEGSAVGIPEDFAVFSQRSRGEPPLRACRGLRKSSPLAQRAFVGLQDASQDYAMTESQIRLRAASPYVLSDAFTMSDVAERSREAYLTLMKSAVMPFRDADLAEWLKGPYRRATTPAAAMLSRAPTPFAVSRGSLDVHVDVLTLQAREEALEVLRHLKGDGVANESRPDTSITFEALNRGFIVECRDGAGTRGHVPVDAPGMKLYERVLSLIAVDYIARPHDFEERLTLCARCEMPYFEGRHACPRAHTTGHRRVAMVAVRRAG